MRRFFRAPAMCLCLLSAALADISESYEGLFYPQKAVAVVDAPGGLAVNTHTGNVLLKRNLLYVPSRGLPIHFWLTYNSDHRQISSPVGKGWGLSYFMRYVEDASGDVTILWGDGRQDRFDWNGGAFVPPPGVYSELSEPLPNRFRLRSKKGLVLLFDDPGHQGLTAVEDPNGNALRLDYDSRNLLRGVADSVGRSYGLDYGPDGRLISIIDTNAPGGRTIEFEYDTEGHLTRCIRPEENVELYVYDSVDRLVTVSNALGNTTRLTYQLSPWDPQTHLPQSIADDHEALEYTLGEAPQTMKIQSTNGLVTWQYEYDATGDLVVVTDPLSNDTVYAWDPDGNMTSRTDALGYRWEWTYDAHGNILTWRDPLGNANVFTYEPAFSRLLTATDRNSNTWTHAYDPAGNRVISLDPYSNTIGRAFDNWGQLTNLTDRQGHRFKIDRDEIGSVLCIVDPLEHRTHFEHDGANRLATTTDPNSNSTHYAYDGYDRLISRTDAEGDTTSYDYDARGNLVRVTDPLSNHVHYVYDSIDRLVSVTNARGHTCRYDYDARGNVTNYTDWRGNRWWTWRDSLDRVVRRSNPLTNAWTYTYDAVGNRVQQTDPNGHAISNSYDALHRLVERDLGDGTRAAYRYDAVGNLVEAGDSVSAYAFEFDRLNRRTAVSNLLDGHAIEYTYDAGDRIVETVGPTGERVQYTFDAAGRRASMAVEDSPAVGGAPPAPTRDIALPSLFEYDPAGNLVTQTRPNALRSVFEYTPDNRVRSVTHVSIPSNVVMQSFAYLRDALGRITNVVTDSGETVVFEYDAAGNLVVETGGSGLETYERWQTYDANGNRVGTLNVLPFGGQSSTVEFDAANQPVKDDRGLEVTLFRYDLNGNRVMETSQFHQVVFGYNTRNQLTNVFQNGTHVEFVHDVFDRVTIVNENGNTNRFVYNGRKPVAGSRASGGTLDWTQQEVCLFSFRDLNSGETYQVHPGGTFLSGVFRGAPLSLVTDGAGQVVGRQTYHMDGETRFETNAVPPPPLVAPWMNGAGQVYHHGPSGLTLTEGVAFDGARQQPLNLPELGNSVPWAKHRLFDATSGPPDGGFHHFTVAGPGTPAQRVVPAFDLNAGPLNHRAPPIAAGPLEVRGLPGRLEGTWFGSYAAGFPAINGYTFVAVNNTSSANNTVTVEFRGTDGEELAQTNWELKPNATWTLSSALDSGVSSAPPIVSGGPPIRPLLYPDDLWDFIQHGRRPW